MAFVPVDVRVPSKADIVRTERSNILDCHIASDPTDDRLLFVSCQLFFLNTNFTIDIPEPYFEFSYEIAIVDQIDPNRSFATQDRFEVRRLISDQLAQSLRASVIDACRVLFEEVRPTLVYRVTKARKPPARALEKHHEITDLLSTMGYTVILQGYDVFGRYHWLMRHSPGKEVSGR